MKNKRKTTIRALIIVAIIILVFVICIISKIKLYTYNPIRAGMGYIAVKVLDKDYIKVQNIPNKVIYSNSRWDFNEYMKEKGYIEILEEQLGAQHVFTNGQTKQYVFITYSRNPFKVYEFSRKEKDDSGISMETRNKNYEEQTTKRSKTLEWMVNNINEVNL